MKSQIFTFRDLGKHFAGKWVFQKASGTIRKGDRIALMGENGAGKTTLLLLLTGILKPSEGEINRFCQKIGLISHEPMLYPNLALWENLLFFGQMAGLNKKEATTRTTEILQYFDLYGFRMALPMELSRGMLQRLLWARLALCNFQVLFLDEPFNSLDTKWLQILLDALKEGGIEDIDWNFHTYLIVEHDPNITKHLVSIKWFLKNSQLLLEEGYVS